MTSVETALLLLSVPLAVYLFLLFVVVPCGLIAEKIDDWRHGYIAIGD